jgi:tetratricopeptide (TPR) repeat protein
MQKEWQYQRSQQLFYWVNIFDLHKYNDAIESFSKSITLFESINSTVAYETYYYLGLSEMQEVKLQAATNYFDKASTINKTRQQ